MSASVRRRLAELPRVRLLTARPPLERWDRLSEMLGIRLFVKREDLGGIGGGGNKLRKLELLIGEAGKQGATWVLTTGGPQSNHARLTAAAAARSQMGCTLVLRGGWQGPPTGNLLLDHLFGADVQLLGDVGYAAADLAMTKAAAALVETNIFPSRKSAKS